MPKLVGAFLVCLTILLVAAIISQPQAQLPSPIGIINALDAGCTPYHLAGGTGASTNSNEIENVPSRLCDLTLINTTTTIYYLHVYDTASAPTCSSSTGLKHTYPIPPSVASGGASGIQRSLGTGGGEIYLNGIGYCVTGGGGDGDNTNAAAGVYVEGSYRTVPP